jgi:hypothetical protein
LIVEGQAEVTAIRFFSTSLPDLLRFRRKSETLPRFYKKECYKKELARDAKWYTLLSTETFKKERR